MRFLTLSIAVFVLAGVAYVSVRTPSSAAVFSQDAKGALVNAPAH